MLAKLKGVRLEDVYEVLERDAEAHAKEGIYLQHLWQNVDDQDEVLFLFRVDDIENVKSFISEVHRKAYEENPDSHLPHMTYLEGKGILFGL